MKPKCRTLLILILLIFTLFHGAPPVNAGPPPGGYLDEKKYPNIVKPDVQFGSFGKERGQLNEPVDSYICNHGLIYIADSLNDRIQVFDRNGQSIMIIGGEDATVLRSPQGVALNPAEDKLFVADTGNHRIQVFSIDGELLYGWGQFGTDSGQFKEPIGVTVDDKFVYVSDTGNNRIQIFDHNGKFINKFGKYGTSSESFNYPRSVTVDEAGSIYVANTNNNQISKYTPDGKFDFSWGEYGSLQGEMVQPSDIFYSKGELYVSDLVNHRIQVYDTKGKFQYQFGRHPPKRHEGNGRIHYPMTLSTSPDGSMLVACEPFEHRCQLFNDTSVSQVINVNDSAWWFKGPTRFHYGARADVAGNLLAISEEETHTALLFDISGDKPTFKGALGGFGDGAKQLVNPSGVAFSPDKKSLFVSDRGHHQIKHFMLPSDREMTIADFPSAVESLPSIGTYGSLLGEFNEPADIMVDKNGNLYAIDVENQRIQVFSKNGKPLRTWGTFGTGLGELNRPLNLAFSPDEKTIYVVDSYNSRVQAFDKDGNFKFSWGDANKAAGEIPGYSGKLVYPFGIAVDDNGFVYVTDVAGQKVNKYTGNGSFLQEWGSFGYEAGQFYKPKGIAVDDKGRIYVVDFGNHRAQIFDATGKFIDMFGIGSVYTEPEARAMDVQRAMTGE
jgi:tripartite motif-containing protein 71